MSWRDVYLNKQVSDQQITSALSELFSISSSAIQIVEDSPTLEHIPEAIQIVCGISLLNGDFPQLLEIIPLSKSLFPDDDYDALMRLCIIFDRKILLPDAKIQSHNPYEWTLLQSNTSPQSVWLDSEKLDSENSMIIIRYLHTD